MVVCKYCGHVNENRLYCERCSRPLSEELLKDWLLQKYFENLVMNAESMKEVLSTRREGEFGNVKADYVIEHTDGSKTLLIVTTKIEEVLDELIKYNARRREKINVVFLRVDTESVPPISHEILREALRHGITVTYFKA